MPGKASYTKRQDHEATIFETKPAPCPKYWFVLILFLLMASLAGSAWGTSGFLFVLLGIFFWWRDPRPKAVRGPAKLRVTPTELVSTTEKTYRSDEITNLSIQNLYAEGGTGTSVSGKDLGMKRKQKMRAVSWYVQLDRRDGEQLNIAGGLDSETAHRLLHDICDIMVPKATRAEESGLAG
jgi:hypothetical protein